MSMLADGNYARRVVPSRQAFMTEAAAYMNGPVVRRVQIDLDDIGADLLQRFTRNYIHHSVAVIVDGQIVANFTLLSPVRKGLLSISFPEGDELEAESLRDSLMK